ncbi:hypothetical protein M405DRAFT_860337 [Rhizopogon salebrosus TDB-379]|nr:hypothetical protein M405DRAFT_860337 [Rhizopogon salebrosus TDB-379]
MVQPNTSATVPTGAQARFPWKYACDMVPQLQLFANLSDDQTIQALFTTTFPNCIYTKATFYKHRAAYRAAIENSSDMVECAIDAGYSPAGQWNSLLAEIKANTPSLTGSNGSASDSDMTYHTLPPSLPPMNLSTTDTGSLLPTDLTSDTSDAVIASLLQDLEEMHCDTAATTNSEFPLDFTTSSQFDSFSTWLNNPSALDYSSMGSDVQALLPLPPF